MTLEKETSIYQLGAIAAGIQGAVSIAESKNSIFHQATAPPTSGRKVGDIWYDSDDGYSMYKFDGTTWVQEQYGTNAISAGAITAARLDAQDVYTNFLRVYFLSAAQAEIESLSAITANLGSVIVGGLNNEDGVITIKDASNQTIGFWDNTGINAQAGTIGGWNVGTNTLESSGVINNTTYSAVMQNMTGTDLNRRAFFVHVTPSGTPDYYPFYVKYDGTVGMNTCYVSRAIFFQSFNDSALLVNSYGGDTYNLIRNHNNGNISVSASGGTLHLGYENTTGINFFNGAYIFGTNYAEITNANNPVWLRVRNSASGNGIFIQSNVDGTVELASYGANGTRYGILQRANNSNAITTYGTWSFTSSIVSSNSSGQAIVYASNGGTSNRIFIYADASNGQAGLYSYDASNTGRAILIRDNNSNNITAYGAWTFNTGIKGNNNYTGIPVLTESSGASRISYMASATGYVLRVNALWGGSSYATASATFTSSDIRLKKNIKDSKVEALPIINDIKIREFDWKDGRHQSIGFIADELEKLDKALTIGGGYTDDNEMSIKSVDTFYLLGYAIKAIQELSAEVKRLKGVA